LIGKAYKIGLFKTLDIQDEKTTSKL